MEGYEESEGKHNLQTGPGQSQAKGARKSRPKLEHDIFGNEYLGTRQVLRLVLPFEDLPDGLHLLLNVIDIMELIDVDLPSVLNDALNAVPQEFWNAKLDEYTPLEWKLRQAMESETFRESVKDLLSTIRDDESL